jgi:hypothetical protein
LLRFNLFNVAYKLSPFLAQRVPLLPHPSSSSVSSSQRPPRRRFSRRSLVWSPSSASSAVPGAREGQSGRTRRLERAGLLLPPSSSAATARCRLRPRFRSSRRSSRGGSRRWGPSTASRWLTFAWFDTVLCTAPPAQSSTLSASSRPSSAVSHPSVPRGTTSPRLARWGPPRSLLHELRYFAAMCTRGAPASLSATLSRAPFAIEWMTVSIDIPQMPQGEDHPL